jgi:hypothetical protein
MPNAYDDLLNQPPPAEPPVGKNAYADLMPAEQQITKTPEHQPTYLEGAERGLGLTARAAIQGITGLPSMVADFGHSIYDLATSPEARSATWEAAKHPSQWLTPPNDSPSGAFNRSLDPYLPNPETKAEKGLSILLGAETGAMMPQVPVPGAQAPANFMNETQQKAQRLAQSLQKSKEGGLVVPPSTTNPTLLNKTLETIGGKEATQNQARTINQNARNDLAAGDLGLKPEVFTPGAVAAVKEEAGKGFEAARSIPAVQTDSQYIEDLSKVLKESHGSNASFPGSANPDVEKIVDTYLQPNFTGDAGVSAIKMLRAKASDAYRQGNSELGMAYKGVSSAIESQMERGAQNLGGPYANLVSALRQARQTYAKASTIEDAMDAQGNVSGTKLAQAWKRGEPLSGGTLTAAEHAVNYPKANLPANSSNISHLNMYGAPAISFLTEHATGSPWGLAAGAALPMGRSLSRSYLLSGMGQKGALPVPIPKEPKELGMLAKALRDMRSNPNALAGAYNASK